MIPSEDNDGHGRTRHREHEVRSSLRPAMGKRGLIVGVSLLFLSLVITIAQAKLCAGAGWSESCSFWSINGPWALFWVFMIFIGVLLIAAIVRALRKR